MAQHLQELKDSNPINIPLYDFATHSRKEECIKQRPKKVIIVDGILILGQPSLRDIFSESVFVQTPERIRFERRLNRDVKERGRTPAGVKAQFEKQVKPMHDLFVEPSKKQATHVSSGVDMEAFYNLLRDIQKRVSDSDMQANFNSIKEERTQIIY